MNINTPIEKVIQRAEEALSDANYSFDNGRFEATANRAYYAVFYCVTAFLIAKGISTKTHRGAHNKFNELYIKTQLLPQIMNEYLDVVSSLRESADYDFEMEITLQNAQLAINHAREFLAATKKHFNLHE